MGTGLLILLLFELDHSLKLFVVERDPNDSSLEDLVTVLTPNAFERIPLLNYNGPDVEGLEPTDPSICGCVGRGHCGIGCYRKQR